MTDANLQADIWFSGFIVGLQMIVARYHKSGPPSSDGIEQLIRTTQSQIHDPDLTGADPVLQHHIQRMREIVGEEKS